MDSSEHYRDGPANIVTAPATNGENVVLTQFGRDDGPYPVALIRDDDGSPLGLHIDLGVVENLSDDESGDA